MLISDISAKFLEDYNTPGNGFKFLHKSVFDFVLGKTSYFKPLLKCTGRGSTIIMNCYESKKEFLKVLEEIKSGEYLPIDGFKMFYIVSIDKSNIFVDILFPIYLAFLGVAHKCKRSAI